jgi:riboflavin kinase/FMN adenylyltransferase
LEAFVASRPVLTMGTFDGFHRGHGKILQTLRERAKELGGESVVMTFWPHPRLVLRPDDLSLSLLSTLDERVALLAKQGIDHLIVCPFTLEFAQMSSNDFIRSVLVEQLKITHLVVGFNHTFGRNREGNFDSLVQCAADCGFGIERVEALVDGPGFISSTKIREALLAGDIETATLSLQRPYSIAGQVIQGKQLGRKLGFPTANMEADLYKLVPKDGVYAVQVAFGEKLWKAMLNIGMRPTIDEPRRDKTIEVHIFDFDQQIYGQRLELRFLKRVRSEHRFDSLEALSQQLVADKAFVLDFFETVNQA